MGEVQGQVLVADLNADGKMEIFAGAGVPVCSSAASSRQGSLVLDCGLGRRL
jgi:hypothetical protein